VSSFVKNRFAVKMFQKTLGFAGWMQNLPNKMTPPPMRLMQIGSLFWQSRILYVAVKLDIASILGDQKLSINDLAAKSSCHSDSLYRLLRMLISMGIFTEIEPGIIANNKTSAFLDEEHPQCVRSMILMHNSPEMTKPWIEDMENGIRSGEIPFSLAYGENMFDYMDSHAEFESLFSKAMDTTEAIIGDTFLTDFDWGRYERLIDVGGSKGSKSIAILKQHPQLKAVVYDRSRIIEKAQNFWDGKVDPSVLERIEFVSGDARERVPTANSDKDVYLLCALSHGLKEDDSVQVLRNIDQATSDHKADVIIMDLALTEQNENLMLTSFDMQMFVGTEGRERTAKEWNELCDKGGFRIEQTFDTRSLGKLQLLRSKKI
jgi:hypothetical protein